MDRKMKFLMVALHEAGIDYDTDNTLLTGEGCVIISSPEQAEQGQPALRLALCDATDDELRKALDIINEELAARPRPTED